MVAIIENYALIVGQIIAIDKNGERNELKIQVSDLKNYQQYPNLINLISGNQLTVQLSNSEADALDMKEGQKIKAVVRAVAGNKYFFKPDSIDVNI